MSSVVCRPITIGSEAGYGTDESDVIFHVNLPYNKEPASFGNGVQIRFSAKNRDTVGRFHAKVLALGGTDEGAPGERGCQSKIDSICNTPHQKSRSKTASCCLRGSDF